MELQIIPALLLVSVAFFLALLVYIWLNQKQNLFYWLMIGAVTMLTIFYTFLAILKLLGKYLLQHPIGCEVVALILQYSYMSAIFWLTSMSQMVWKIFRKIVPVVHGTQYKLGCQNPKFKWYALFAWGCPLLVTFVTLTMKHLPAEITEGFSNYSYL